MPNTMSDGSPWPRISIVTPSYNQGQFIEETIRFVLLQGYPNLEYIIIDGGSTDGSKEIIQRYSDHLAYWTSEPDKGQSDAINKGFARCTGELITFCNSDDYYLPDVFTDVAEVYQDFPNCGAIVGGFVYVDEAGGYTGDVLWPEIRASAPVDLTLGPPGVYRLHQAATFFTRQALDGVGRYVRDDLRFVMDRELLYRVARKYPILTRNVAYAAFRLHAHSKSVSQIMPFAQEFSRLYLESVSGDSSDDQQRREMARVHIVKGYLKYARHAGRSRDRIGSLLWAAALQPNLLWQRSYIIAWLEAVRLKERL